MYNLELLHQRQFFHSNFEICSLVDNHWDTLCVGKNRTVTWWATLHAQITQNKHLFKTISYGSGYWGITHSHDPSTQLSAVRNYKDKVKWEVQDQDSAGNPDDQLNKKILRKRKPKHPPRSETPLTPTKPPTDALQTDQHQPKKKGRKKKLPDDPANANKNVTCHHCRHRVPFAAANPCYQKGCTKRYCQSCLESQYNLELQVVKAETWSCPHCLKVCSGIRCSEEVTSNITPATTPTKKLPHTPIKVKPGTPIERIVAKSIKNLATKYLVLFSGYDVSSCLWFSPTQLSTHPNFKEAIEKFENSPRIWVKKDSLKWAQKKRGRPSLSSPGQTNKTPQKKRRRHEGRRNSDFDLDKIITYGQTHIPVVKPKPQNVLTPSFRLRPTYDEELDKLSEHGYIATEWGDESESEENTDDEHYALIHEQFVMPFEVGLFTSKEEQKKQQRKREQLTDSAQIAKEIESQDILQVDEAEEE
jgi:hypothetical protein